MIMSSAGHRMEKRFAVRDNSYKIRIYETTTFIKQREVEIPGAHLAGPISWSPDGRTFAVWQEGGDVKLLDENYVEIRSLKPNHGVTQFLWTTNSQQLALVGPQTSVWDTTTGQLKQTIASGGIADWVTPDQTMVIGRADGIQEIRSLIGPPIARSSDRGRPLNGLAMLAPDGSELVTRIGTDLLFWNAASGESKDKFTNVVPNNCDLRWSPDGKLLAAWSDKKLIVIARADCQTKADCVGHEAAISTCRWSSDSGRLVSVAGDNTLRIWNAAQGTELSKQYFETPPQDAAWSHDGKSLACVRKGELVFLTPDGTSITSRHPTPSDYAFRIGSAQGLAWSPDDSQLTTGIYNEKVITWNMGESNWDTIGDAYPIAPYVGAMSWSTDGTRLIASTTYGDAVAIEIDSGKAKQVFPCSFGQWRGDTHVFMTGLFNNLDLYGYDADNHQRTGVLIPSLSGGAGKSLCISNDGHVRGDIASIVYVALTEDGRQLTYRLADFEKTYDWKNDLRKLRFLVQQLPRHQRHLRYRV